MLPVKASKLQSAEAEGESPHLNLIVLLPSLLTYTEDKAIFPSIIHPSKIPCKSCKNIY
jgi:hypothetical protein